METLKQNLILLSDSYKYTHAQQYPPNTTNVYSYFESRGGKWPTTTFFGLQYFLKRYLDGQAICLMDIEEAEKVVNAHIGPGMFNRKGWMYILEKHDGRLPIVIRAVPEGTTAPCLTPLMTIENTDPACWWLTNFLETLLVQVWYPTTVCTQSRAIKAIITDFLDRTGDPKGVDFKLHDFGFRGVSSVESAGIGGAAHLVNFMGTDTVAGLMVARQYYGAEMPGFSIPAAEHSTICSWGKENEVKAFENMLDQFPKGLMACVSDSYDIWHACAQHWGKDLKDKVLARDGTLVVRPDSGLPEAVVPRVLNILGNALGYTKNAKGYKVLDPHVRVIQGDGVDSESIPRILNAITDAGWSTDNLAFGMGGALLQKLNRDTQMFAFKCSSVIVNGVQHDVRKTPVTADWKRSKAGRFNVGIAVFKDGKLMADQKFDAIKARAAL